MLECSSLSFDSSIIASLRVSNQGGKRDERVNLNDSVLRLRSILTPSCLSAEVQENIPAMFRRAAINAALGSARSFYSHLARWQKSKEKAEAKGKKCKDRPPVPPRSWNKIRNYDDSLAHLVSARIVQFAQEHEASILVFEHLGNLKPEI